jgi:transposase InsO family protein
MTARAFLQAPIDAVPHRIHTILTDNGIQFAPLPKNRSGPTARYMGARHKGHPVGDLCRAHDIEHRLTKPNHPWTNGQVERMNRTIKDATVRRFHDDDHDRLRRHLSDFVDACDFARRLKTLGGLTPYEFVRKCWADEPNRFKFDPSHQLAGLNT